MIKETGDTKLSLKKQKTGKKKKDRKEKRLTETTLLGKPLFLPAYIHLDVWVLFVVEEALPLNSYEYLLVCPRLNKI